MYCITKYNRSFDGITFCAAKLTLILYSNLTLNVSTHRLKCNFNALEKVAIQIIAF